MQLILPKQTLPKFPTYREISVASVRQRLFNYIDDKMLINKLLAPREVGHEVDTTAKAHSFVNLSANEYGRERFPLRDG